MTRLDYFAPGVYVEEVDRGSRPIEGISMSVGGFVGFTEDIRSNAQRFQPMLVTNWNQYLEYFAKPGSNGFTDFNAYLPFAVRGWFENGGGRCWVVSVGTQLPGHSDESADTSHEETGLSSLESNGAVAPVRVTVVRTAGGRSSLALSLKPEKADDVERIRILIGSDTPCSVSSLREEVLDEGLFDEADTENSPPATPSMDTELVLDEPPFDTGEFFQISLFKGEERLEGPYRHLSMDANVAQNAGQFVLTALRQSEFVNIEVLARRGYPISRKPANGIYEVSTNQLPPRRLDHAIYGQSGDRTGIRGLFEIDEVSMVACPDLMLAYKKNLVDLNQVHAIMELMITSCEDAAPSPKYRMAVLDMPPVRLDRGNGAIAAEQQKPQHAVQWLDEFSRRSDMAAIYYPWIKVANPRNQGKPILIPPCGHMMGIWCHTDETRGVYKAPANVQPRGVIGMAYDVNFREQELLNPMGINCIRRFPNRGIRVWGARTLVEPDNIPWRYISVRRLMSYVEKSIELGTQWAVFEPNDEDLWARVTRTVTNFLERIWREGALFGSTPAEAFYVKCDGELNTPETMMLGRLYVEVGVAPVRPAEFVVFRISQWAPNQ
ncbi:MAG: phage tail sheath family protein [Elainellaceae cyanobacterium]